MKQLSLTKEQGKKITAIARESGAVIAYLFGSYARGTAGHLSDVDIGVAFKREISPEDQENRIETIRSDLERIFGRDKADVVNVPMIRDPLLRYLITLGEGKVLFADDLSLRNDLAFKALREYEDTRNLRAIQNQALGSLFA